MSEDVSTAVWTPRTLAEAAGVTSSYIRLLLTTAKLRGQKMGGVWLIPYEEGQRWLEEHTAKSETQSEATPLTTES